MAQRARRASVCHLIGTAIASTTGMTLRIWTVAIVALVAATACAEAIDDVGSSPDAGFAGSGGVGAGGAPGCTPDRSGAGGAVHVDPIVPPVGSWCPENGFELCTHRWDGSSPPNDVLSRCTDNAWQTIAGATCVGGSECHIWPPRQLDGECCSRVAYCAEAFCDGTRWWSHR
jgi:hypothetical protein